MAVDTGSQITAEVSVRSRPACVCALPCAPSDVACACSRNPLMSANWKHGTWTTPNKIRDFPTSRALRNSMPSLTCCTVSRCAHWFSVEILTMSSQATLATSREIGALRLLRRSRTFQYVVYSSCFCCSANSCEVTYGVMQSCEWTLPYCKMSTASSPDLYTLRVSGASQTGLLQSLTLETLACYHGS